jgi:hypothetical protein
VNRLAIAVALAGLLVSASAVEAKAPLTWDGLVQVKSKRLDLVYLQPGADFRIYSKVLVEPTEVSFAKDWQRDYNRSSRTSRISDNEIQETISEAVKAADTIFANAWTKGGYALASAPGPDVLRVKTGVVNIWLNAPDRPMIGRSHTFAGEAGRATLFVEARDSMTGALLGRAVDQRIVGDNMAALRTSVSNRGDFRDRVQHWADISVRGVNELKSLSPIQP